MQGTDAKLRVVIVEDHGIFLDALTQAMSLEDDIEVVGSCITPDVALCIIEQKPVDVLVADLEWRGDALSGIKLIHRARAAAPALEAVVCSAHGDDEYVLQAIRAGAKGYLLKTEIRNADVVQAVRTVGRGESFYSTSVLQTVTRLLQGVPHETHPMLVVEPLDKLTPREQEVVALVMDGLSNAEIGAKLDIAEKTVKTHMSSILSKLGLTSRYQVTGYMQKHKR